MLTAFKCASGIGIRLIICLEFHILRCVGNSGGREDSGILIERTRTKLAIFKIVY